MTHSSLVLECVGLSLDKSMSCDANPIRVNHMVWYLNMSCPISQEKTWNRTQLPSARAVQRKTILSGKCLAPGGVHSKEICFFHANCIHVCSFYKFGRGHSCGYVQNTHNPKTMQHLRTAAVNDTVHWRTRRNHRSRSQIMVLARVGDHPWLQSCDWSVCLQAADGVRHATRFCWTAMMHPPTHKQSRLLVIKDLNYKQKKTLCERRTTTRAITATSPTTKPKLHIISTCISTTKLKYKDTIENIPNANVKYGLDHHIE